MAVPQVNGPPPGFDLDAPPPGFTIDTPQVSPEQAESDYRKRFLEGGQQQNIPAQLRAKMFQAAESGKTPQQISSMVPKGWSETGRRVLLSDTQDYLKALKGLPSTSNPFGIIPGRPQENAFYSGGGTPIYVPVENPYQKEAEQAAKDPTAWGAVKSFGYGMGNRENMGFLPAGGLLGRGGGTALAGAFAVANTPHIIEEAQKGHTGRALTEGLLSYGLPLGAEALGRAAETSSFKAGAPAREGAYSGTIRKALENHPYSSDSLIKQAEAQADRPGGSLGRYPFPQDFQQKLDEIQNKGSYNGLRVFGTEPVPESGPNPQIYIEPQFRRMPGFNSPYDEGGGSPVQGGPQPYIPPVQPGEEGAPYAGGIQFKPGTPDYGPTGLRGQNPYPNNYGSYLNPGDMESYAGDVQARTSQESPSDVLKRQMAIQRELTAQIEQAKSARAGAAPKPEDFDNPQDYNRAAEDYARSLTIARGKRMAGTSSEELSGDFGGTKEQADRVIKDITDENMRKAAEAASKATQREKRKQTQAAKIESTPERSSNFQDILDALSRHEEPPTVETPPETSSEPNTPVIGQTLVTKGGTRLRVTDIAEDGTAILKRVGSSGKVLKSSEEITATKEDLSRLTPSGDKNVSGPTIKTRGGESGAFDLSIFKRKPKPDLTPDQVGANHPDRIKMKKLLEDRTGDRLHDEAMDVSSQEFRDKMMEDSRKRAMKAALRGDMDTVEFEKQQQVKDQEFYKRQIERRTNSRAQVEKMLDAMYEPGGKYYDPSRYPKPEDASKPPKRRMNQRGFTTLPVGDLNELAAIGKKMGVTFWEYMAEARERGLKGNPKEAWAKAGGALSSAVAPASPSQGRSSEDQEAVGKITQAMKTAEKLTPEQLAGYSAERGKRFDQFKQNLKTAKGEAGLRGAFSALAGEMPQPDFQAIRGKLGQETADRLSEIASRYGTTKSRSFTVATATKGLGKMLDKGQVPNTSELKALEEIYGKDFADIMRTKGSKAADLVLRIQRFALLSGSHSFMKIAEYGAANDVFAATDAAMDTALKPLGKALGTPLYTKQFALKAPTEGNASSSNMAKAFKREVSLATLKDMGDAFITGKNSLDRAFGDYEGPNDPVLEFFQRAHNMLKTPTQIRTFHYAARQAMDWARKNPELARKQFGSNLQDGVLDYAYQQSSRAKLMNENFASKAMRGVTNALKDLPGDAKAPGEVAALLTRFNLPITRVPTNFVSVVANLFAGAPIGVGKVMATNIRAKGFGRGMIDSFSTRAAEALTPEQADIVTRAFKRQRTGVALFALGWFLKDKIEEKDNKVFVAGQEIPPAARHVPQFEVIFAGAGAARAKSEGKSTSQFVAERGLKMAHEVPFIEQTEQVAEGLKNPTAIGSLAGREAKTFIPQLVQQDAKQKDEYRKRKASGFIEQLQEGTYLRKNLPLR